ncbi:gliding motility-associated C-terminal domain-containing protein [Hymenobacter sediminicola]|uniref:Gliding motility-associated C-terminal domain-containing protein n=1 Tax=Hymenobacter sediminicola TaxID=2761579 RepID=A0A7G7W5P1_9BACT|nr:gliding motility-associated C-terminal domain-containing protein [Hymenobacter sediminicola]QNH61684.1 gliding motility-associated C-terminal domain-containing protein [Hymenobacter sediminicola]
MPATLLRICLLTLLWLVAGLRTTTATHLVGGELSYVYLDARGTTANPYRYQITARVYFNKEVGSAAPNGSATLPITVFSKEANPRQLVQVNVGRRSFSEITPALLPGCTERAPRVTLAIYVTTVSLPAISQGYLATIISRNRNAGIANLAYSEGSAMALSVDMTPPMLVNSSPVFSSNAGAVICLGDTTLVVNNAYDADGDRLSYSLATPNENVVPDAPVTYGPDFSAQAPFGPTGYAAVDARSGIARYLGTQVGTFLLAIDVREFRIINGQEALLGTVRRDIQITVRNCGGGINQPPVFTAASTVRQDFVVTEGQALDFTVTATDPDAQPLTMTVSSVLLDGAGPIDATLNGQTGTGTGSAPGIVSVAGSGTVAGIFRLQADCGLARAAPYDVVISVADQACNSKFVVAVFRITVMGVAPPAGLRGDSVLCAQALGTYTALGANFPQYRWTAQGGTIVEPATGRTVQVNWLTGGTGTVTVRGIASSGCPTDSVSRQVQVKPGPQITGAGLYCLAANRGLTYTIEGPLGAYQWSVTDGTIVSGQGTNTVLVDVVRGASAVLQVANPALTTCVTSLRISPDDACLAFFNVITPNGDGRNDVFEIQNLERHPNTQLTIFNRWGRQLYYSADYRNDYGGESTSAGMYYYLCQLADGTRYKGWFDVVR